MSERAAGQVGDETRGAWWARLARIMDGAREPWCKKLLKLIGLAADLGLYLNESFVDRPRRCVEPVLKG